MHAYPFFVLELKAANKALAQENKSLKSEMEGNPNSTKGIIHFIDLETIIMHAGMSQNENIEDINIDKETGIDEDSNQPVEENVHETQTGLHYI